MDNVVAKDVLEADHGGAGLDAGAAKAVVASAEGARFYHGLVDMGR